MEEKGRLIKRFDSSGLPCLVERVYLGENFPFIRAYVGVPKTHWLYKVDFHDLPEIEAHGGGLCYSAERNAVLGETPGVWWLGFECAYQCDVRAEEEYFMELQCIQVARQIGGGEPKPNNLRELSA